VVVRLIAQHEMTSEQIAGVANVGCKSVVQLPRPRDTVV
jgi:hypothetical protein